MNSLLLTLVVTLTLSSSADGLDSLLHVQRERAGVFAEGLFGVIDKGAEAGLNSEELSDFQFLTSYLQLTKHV